MEDYIYTSIYVGRLYILQIIKLCFNRTFSVTLLIWITFFPFLSHDDLDRFTEAAFDWVWLLPFLRKSISISARRLVEEERALRWCLTNVLLVTDWRSLWDDVLVTALFSIRLYMYSFRTLLRWVINVLWIKKLIMRVQSFVTQLTINSYFRATHVILLSPPVCANSLSIFSIALSIESRSSESTYKLSQKRSIHWS